MKFQKFEFCLIALLLFGLIAPGLAQADWQNAGWEEIDGFTDEVTAKVIETGYLPDLPVNPPSPVLNKGRWILSGANPVQDAPSLDSNYWYILPNWTYIDRTNQKGYLLAHIRYVDTSDRHIALFTFDPDTPNSLTFEGIILSPSGVNEREGLGGIFEAVMAVVGEKVYIYYHSYDPGEPATHNTLLATADLSDIPGTITKQGMILENISLTVTYYNGMFYAVNGSNVYLDIYTSPDGTNFTKIADPFATSVSLDAKSWIKMLGDNTMWMIYNERVGTHPLKQFIIDFTPFRQTLVEQGTVLEPVAGTTYSAVTDGMNLWSWKGTWYGYVSGADNIDYSTTQIHLFEWENGTQTYSDAITVTNNFVSNTENDYGIGTNAPQEKLHVYGAAGPVRIEVESGNTSAAVLKMTNSSGSFSNFTFDGGYDVYDNTASATRMYIDSAGFIGFGTDNPGAHLHVSGTGTQMIEVESTDTDQAGVKFKNTDITLKIINSGGALKVFNDTLGQATTVLDDGSGNVALAADKDLTLSGTGQLNLPAGTAAAPAVAWGDTGFRLNSAGVIGISNSGVSRWQMSSTIFGNVAAARPALLGEDATALNPNVVARTDQPGSGMGSAGTGQPNMIADSIEVMRFNTATTGVNYFDITPSATGDPVIIASAGTDADVNMLLDPKGTGIVKADSDVEVNGGGRLNTATASPTCDASTVATMWITQGGAGVTDGLYVCLKAAADTYSWIAVVTGG